MESQQVTLLPVDVADVTILVDNFFDILLPSDEVAHRAPMHYDWSDREQLIAEHGYSLLLTVIREGLSESVLYDAGLGRRTVLHNMDVLEIKALDLRAVILSHGHADHHGGLEGMFQRIGRPGMPLVLHPDVWRERRIVFPSGQEVRMPPPSHADLDREGVEIIEERSPTLLLDGMVLVTGQVDRVTDFEKGFPIQQMHTDHGWEPDTWIWDDQAVVCNVKDKGLVVLSSCSHAGAINVLKHAQRLTGIDKVHAFVGGFHLTGGLFEPIIPRTITELIAIGPDIIVPGHCTGWHATHELARQLPDAYVQTSVGTRLHFNEIQLGCSLVDNWLIPRQRDRFTFSLSSFKPDFFSGQDLSKGLFRNISEGRAILQVGYIADIPLVFLAIENVNMIIFHVIYTLANRSFSPSTSGPTLVAAS
jgi:7,8-dihydropterin-6-yl-methyl-4-(beta-D-ribofuranosyl)aminobenzene 5'-phosphate synthase